MPKISLLKIDALLKGELDPDEAQRVSRAIEASPAAKDYLDRQRALKSGLTLESLRKAIEADRASGPRDSVLRVLSAIREKSASIGRTAWIPAGAVAILVAVLLIRTAWIPTGEDTANRFTSKGSHTDAIARLQLKGLGYDPGSRIPARPGDTLGLLYRCQDSLSMRVFYREEGGAIESFGEGNPMNFTLPPATAWSSAPQRILLEGKWTRQELWLVLSRSPIGIDRAREAIEPGGNRQGATVLSFLLDTGS